MLIRFVAAFLLCLIPVSARVIYVSFDGLGHHLLTQDPVGSELTVFRELARAGACAKGMVAHFPSTTSNSHAALFTGAWGDVNGIMANSMPAYPRAQHALTERINGYRSDGLRAEPIWVTAARQGLRAVGHQVTQAYPFVPMNTGGNLATPPTIVNGYQTKLIAPWTVLTPANTQPGPCSTRCITWTAGGLTFNATFTANEVTIESAGLRTTARLADFESEPPIKRELGRHFSAALPLETSLGPSAVYFRLFELTPNHFTILQTPIHELGVYSPNQPDLRKRLIAEAGGFIGNGPHIDELGKPMNEGGDGTAERRYLEAAELLTRQMLAHAHWLDRNLKPDLFIGYLPIPDETEHHWKGLAARDARFNAFRRWALKVVNIAAQSYLELRHPGDDVVFTSDHGMAAVFQGVNIDKALADAGLSEKVVHLRNCLWINTTDWKSGIVAPSDREAVLNQAVRALAAIRDPASSRRTVTRCWTTKADAERFGYGADACFDYAPGYVAGNLKAPEGYHGFVPTRPEMKAILIAAGSRIRPNTSWNNVRSIDAAVLVCDLLGIKPPPQARGRSLLGRGQYAAQ